MTGPARGLSEATAGRARSRLAQRPVLRLLATLLGVTLLASACGQGGSQSGSSSGSAAPGGSGVSSAGSGASTLTVEVAQLFTTSPISVAINDRTFDAAGLKVTPVPYDPATSVSLVLQGQAQVGFGGLGAVLIAISKGIPVTIISGTAIQGTTDELNLTGMVTKANSGITSYGDLTGKTVAVNALKNDAQALIQNKIDAAGGDSAKTKFVAIPFPGMTNALTAGQVDAVASAAPFLQTLVAQQNTNIGPYAGPGDTNGVLFVSNRYLDSNRSTVETFRRALSAEYKRLNEDRSPAVKVMVDDYKTPAKLVSAIPDVKWRVEVAPEVYQRNLDILKKYGVLQGDVDLQKAILK